MMQELFVIFVISLLLLWLVCSVIIQFSPPWFSSIYRYDQFSLLPLWTFFAPNPGMSDYHLLYRDQREDGSLSAWVEIPMMEERTILSGIWNPEKKSKKVLSDVVMVLVQSGIREGPTLMLSLPYLILLNVVVRHDQQGAGVRRQFVVAEKIRHSDDPMLSIILKSAFHPLQRTRGTPSAVSEIRN